MHWRRGRRAVAPIWGSGILADKKINSQERFKGVNAAEVVTQNIVSGLDVSEWKRLGKRSQYGLITMRRCAHAYVQTRSIHPVHTVRLFVSVLSLVDFFPHPLSVSLSDHLCIFPLHGKLPANPPSAIYSNDSCLEMFHPGSLHSLVSFSDWGVLVGGGV